MFFQIRGTGKSYITQEYGNSRCVPFDCYNKTPKQCSLKIKQLNGDVVQIGNKSKQIISERIANLEQMILNANTPDDFTILGVEINKCTDAEKSYLIPKYVEKYTNNKEKLYKNKQISPQNIFEGIFRKNLTKDEAKQLCSKYKEILQEPDLREYAKKLFEQIKKDFGLNYLPLELKIKEENNAGLGTNGGTSSCLDFMLLKYHKDNPLNRIGIFVILMHELNHAKQNEIAIATDAEAYTRAIASRAHKNPENSTIALNELEKYIIDEIGLETIMNIKNKFGKVDEGTKLYNQGMAYIENAQNYVELSEFDADLFKKYKKQILEKESYDVQYKAEELYYYLIHKK